MLRVWRLSPVRETGRSNTRASCIFKLREPKNRVEQFENTMLPGDIWLYVTFVRCSPCPNATSVRVEFLPKRPVCSAVRGVRQVLFRGGSYWIPGPNGPFFSKIGCNQIERPIFSIPFRSWGPRARKMLKFYWFL